METREKQMWNAKTIVMTIPGVIVALLGMLWLVQGLGIIQIDPILCVGDCEPITGVDGYRYDCIVCGKHPYSSGVEARKSE